MEPQQVGPKGLHRRERTRIFYDILRSILEQEAEGTVAKITKVQNDVNLPSDRLRIHLREMNSLAMIEYGAKLASTDKGKAFVREYEKVVNILQEFGLL